MRNIGRGPPRLPGNSTTSGATPRLDASSGIRPNRHMFALAHLSDPHLAEWSVDRPWALANKRITGWLSWRLNRSRIHLSRVLDLMLADMAEQPIDHVAVTGDLVNISLPQEFENAARWLRRLGAADKVTVVPGNHDAYVTVKRENATGTWRG